MLTENMMTLVSNIRVMSGNMMMMTSSKENMMLMLKHAEEAQRLRTFLDFLGRCLHENC